MFCDDPVGRDQADITWPVSIAGEPAQLSSVTKRHSGGGAEAPAAGPPIPGIWLYGRRDSST